MLARVIRSNHVITLQLMLTVLMLVLQPRTIVQMYKYLYSTVAS